MHSNGLSSPVPTRAGGLPLTPLSTTKELDRALTAVSTKLGAAMEQYQRIARTPAPATRTGSVGGAGSGAASGGAPLVLATDSGFNALTERYHHLLGRFSTPTAAPPPPAVIGAGTRSVPVSPAPNLIGNSAFASPPSSPLPPVSPLQSHSPSPQTSTHVTPKKPTAITVNGISVPQTQALGLIPPASPFSPPLPIASNAAAGTSPTDPTLHAECIRKATVARRQRRRLLNTIAELEAQLRAKMTTANTAPPAVIANGVSGEHKTADSDSTTESGSVSAAAHQKALSALREEYETGKFADAERISSLEEKIEQLTVAVASAEKAAAALTSSTPHAQSTTQPATTHHTELLSTPLPPHHPRSKGAAPPIDTATIITVHDTSASQNGTPSHAVGGSGSVRHTPTAASPAQRHSISFSHAHAHPHSGSPAPASGVDWELERARYILEIESLTVELDTIRHEQKHGHGLLLSRAHATSGGLSGTASPMIVARSVPVSPTHASHGSALVASLAHASGSGSGSGSDGAPLTVEEWKVRYAQLLSGHEKLLAEKDSELEACKKTQRAIISELDQWKSTVQELIANHPPPPPPPQSSQPVTVVVEPTATTAPAAVAPENDSGAAAVAAATAALETARETVKALEKKLEVSTLEREAQKEVLLEQLTDMTDRLHALEQKHSSDTAAANMQAVDAANTQFQNHQSEMVAIADSHARELSTVNDTHQKLVAALNQQIGTLQSELQQLRTEHAGLLHSYENAKRWQSKLTDTEVTRHEHLEVVEHTRMVMYQSALSDLQAQYSRATAKLTATEAREKRLIAQTNARIKQTAKAYAQLRALIAAHNDRNDFTISDLERQLTALLAINDSNEAEAESATADLTATRLMLKGLRRQNTTSGISITSAEIITSSPPSDASADGSSNAGGDTKSIADDSALSSDLTAAATATVTAVPTVIPSTEPLPRGLPALHSFAFAVFVAIFALSMRVWSERHAWI